jgi:predicted O-methyltransferase YrrM
MRVGEVARRVAAPVVRRVPVTRWPARLGGWYGINVPRAVVAHDELSARGTAHVGIVLELLARTAGVPGDVAECGVYRGATFAALALETQRSSGRHLYGFDSFEGFDDTVAIDVALGGQDDGTRRVHGFSDTSLGLVQRKVTWLGLDTTATLVPGYFADTLAAFADRRFAFVHLDCDLYQSYKDCLEFFWPRLSPGAIVLFDEYDDPSWPGANLAIDEFLAREGATLEHLERDNYRRFYVTKPRDASL